MSKMDSATSEGTEGRQPEGSNQGVGQPGSAPEYVTVEQFKAIQKQLEDIARIAQGDKDRAVKRTNERVDRIESGLQDVLRGALQRGQSVSQLLEEIQSNEEEDFRKTMKEVAQALKTGAFPVAGAQGNAPRQGVDVTAVVAELELDPNDLRVREFATRQFASKEEALVAGAKLVKTILTRQPSEADKPAPASGRAAAAGKQDELRAEYDRRAEKLRGSALIELKMEMRRKGLDIN